MRKPSHLVKKTSKPLLYQFYQRAMKKQNFSKEYRDKNAWPNSAADSSEFSLEWGSFSLSQGIFLTQVSCIAGGFFTTEPPGKPFLVEGQLMPIEIRAMNRPESCSLKQEDLICRTLSIGSPSFLGPVSGPKTWVCMNTVGSHHFST